MLIANHLDTDFVTIQDCSASMPAPVEQSDRALQPKRIVHAHLANHFTHSRFGCLNHGVGRDCLLSKRNALASLKRYCTANLISTMFSSSVSMADSRSPVAFDDRITAHINRSNLRHKNRFMTLNRVRKTPVETAR
jgi:hypothetical protein